jgi:hypothetical protein
MLRSFVGWLDDYLAGEGPHAIVRGVIGLLFFAALLSALLGNVAVKAGAIVIELLAMLAVVLILMADRRSMRAELQLHKRLVSRYGKFVDRLNPTYEVLSWEQVAYIANSRGDTKEYVTIRAKVLSDEMLLIRLLFGCGWEQPAKHRRNVSVSVRNLLVDEAPGTSPDVTFSWVSDGKIDMMIHFSAPPRQGSEIRFIVIMDWPGKCAPLMNEGTDEFAFWFNQQQVEYVSYKIVLPAGHEAYYEPIGFEPSDPNFRIDATVSDEGRSQYVFQGFSLPMLMRAGLKLQLKGNGKHGSRQWPAISSLR